MISSIPIHNVSAVRLVDREHSGHKWSVLIFTSADYLGRPVETEITVYPAAGAWPLRVAQPPAPYVLDLVDSDEVPDMMTGRSDD